MTAGASAADEMFALHPSPSEINKGTLNAALYLSLTADRGAVCMGHRLPIHVVTRCPSALNVLGARATEGTHKGVHARYRQRKAHAVAAGTLANLLRAEPPAIL